MLDLSQAGWTEVAGFALPKGSKGHKHSLQMPELAHPGSECWHSSPPDAILPLSFKRTESLLGAHLHPHPASWRCTHTQHTQPAAAWKVGMTHAAAQARHVGNVKNSEENNVSHTERNIPVSTLYSHPHPHPDPGTETLPLQIAK